MRGLETHDHWPCIGRLHPLLERLKGALVAAAGIVLEEVPESWVSSLTGTRLLHRLLEFMELFRALDVDVDFAARGDAIEFSRNVGSKLLVNSAVGVVGPGVL